MPQCHSIITFFRLIDQFNQAVDFGLWLGHHQLIELVYRQMVLQVPHHIKMLPPAVQNFKAGLLMITTDFTIMKRYVVAQSRATPYQFICGIFHNFAPDEQQPILGDTQLTNTRYGLAPTCRETLCRAIGMLVYWINGFWNNGVLGKWSAIWDMIKTKNG